MKKKKIVTKVMAVVFALAILVAMSMPAFADSNTATGNYSANEGSQTLVDTTNNTITLSKTIVYFNPDGEQVRQPSISYNYSISPVDSNSVSNKTVTAPNGESSEVYGGDSDGLATSAIISVTRGTLVDASATGAPHVYTTTINVYPNNFPHAGIYRYMVNESCNDLARTHGVLRADADDSSGSHYRYLDVYIGNGTTAGTFILVGAVLFKTNESINGKEVNNDPTTVYSQKTIGFDVNTDPTSSATVDYSNDNTVDRYFTYNLTVKKEIKGSMANKTNQFPIAVTVSKAEGLTENATVDVSVNDSSKAALGDGQQATQELGPSSLFKAKLADGGELRIKGIPYYPIDNRYPTITVVHEDNNTVDDYTVALAGTNLTAGSPDLGFDNTNNKLNANSDITTPAGTKSFQASQYSPVLTITNTMASMSPTGLAFRVAPYVLMLLAGVSLILIFTKRRREVTDMI